MLLLSPRWGKISATAGLARGEFCITLCQCPCDLRSDEKRRLRLMKVKGGPKVLEKLRQEHYLNSGVQS